MEGMAQCKYPPSKDFMSGGSCGSPHVPDCPLSNNYRQEVIIMADKSPRDKEKKKKKKEKKK